MKLIGSLTSPYVRKVRVFLAEKQIPHEFVVDSPWAAATQVGQHNPLGKVPILLLPGESTLYDSRVIVEYLDRKFPERPLIPLEDAAHIAVKRWEALADGINDAAAEALLESRRPVGEQSPAWIVRQKDKILRGIEALAGEIGEQRYCQGEQFTLADIALTCALAYVAFRHPDIGWQENHPGLNRYYTALAARPAFLSTQPHD